MKKQWAMGVDEHIERFFAAEEERLTNEIEAKKERAKWKDPGIETCKFGAEPMTEADIQELPIRGNTPPGEHAKQQGLAANKLHFWATNLVTSHDLHWEKQPTVVKGLGLHFGQRVPMTAITHWDLRCLKCIAQAPVFCALGFLGLLVPMILMIASNKPPDSDERPQNFGNLTNVSLANGTSVGDAGSGADAAEAALGNLTRPAGNDPADFKFLGMSASACVGLFIVLPMICVVVGRFWDGVHTRMKRQLIESRKRNQLSEDCR